MPVVVTIGDREVYGRSDRGGYIDVVAHDHGLEPGWRQVVVAAQGTDPVPADVYIVGDDVTYGIVSDIDDTVITTTLPRPMIAAWNTFVRSGKTRRAVSGMAPMYRRPLRAPGCAIVYLSTGAWNTIPTLTRFLVESGYPLGPLLMTDWGATNTGWFRSGQEHKRRLTAPPRSRLPEHLVAPRRRRRAARPAAVRRVRRGAPRQGQGHLHPAGSRRPSRCCRTPSVARRVHSAAGPAGGSRPSWLRMGTACCACSSRPAWPASPSRRMSSPRAHPLPDLATRPDAHKRHLCFMAEFRGAGRPDGLAGWAHA